jgi:hypothetical protein
VSPGLKIATLDEVAPLDFKGPFDELTELRSVLTTQEIAELTGLRRETLSRARRDSRFRRRTEKALGDLYVVVTRMRAVAGDDLGQLAPILRRPQAALGGRSIADLLKEGKVEQVLEHLSSPEPADAAAEAVAKAAAAQAFYEREEKRAAAFLAADPELAALLPEIEARVRRHFAPVDWIERGTIVEYEGEADDVLYLSAHNDLSFNENEQRLMAFLEAERDLLLPVRTRLHIGFL